MRLKFQKGCTKLMRTLVEEFIAMFKNSFPAGPIKPKMYNFTHYGTILKQSGPIIILSTNKYETKYKDKKENEGFWCKLSNQYNAHLMYEGIISTRLSIFI